MKTASLAVKAQFRLGNKRGQTLAEYALILALISVVAISVLASMGTQVTAVYSTTNQQISLSESGGPATAPARGH